MESPQVVGLSEVTVDSLKSISGISWEKDILGDRTFDKANSPQFVSISRVLAVGEGL